MKKAIVMNIQRYSIHDGPGIRTTVFLKGCQMRCDWCHNPESQNFSTELMYFESSCIGCGMCEEICHKGAHSFQGGRHKMDVKICADCESKELCAKVCCTGSIQICGKEMNTEEVMKEILRDKDFYGESGGVAFSGGEPLLHEDFLAEILEACKKEDIHTTIDTTADVEWKVFEKIRDLVDLYLIDIKAMDEVLHRKLTGQGNRRILENIRHLSQYGAKMIIRQPFASGVNDSEEELLARRDFLGSLSGVERVDDIQVTNHGERKYRALGRTMNMPGASYK